MVFVPADKKNTLFYTCVDRQTAFDDFFVKTHNDSIKLNVLAQIILEIAYVGHTI